LGVFILAIAVHFIDWSRAMLPNLKIKHQMLLGYAIPVLIYVGFTGIVYSNVERLSAIFKDVKRIETALVQVGEMGWSFQSTVRINRGYLIYQNEEALQQLQEAQREFQVAARNTDEFTRNAQQKQRIAEMVEIANNYNKLADILVDLKRQNKSAEMQALFDRGDARKLVDEFDVLYDEFKAFEQNLLTEESNKAQSDLNTVLIVFVVGTLLIIIIEIVIALMISSGIAHTIYQATSAIATSSTEISVTVEQQERSASQQAASVHQTTTTMDELSASSRQSAERAETSLANGQQVLRLTEIGTQSVNHTLEDMATLKERVGTIAAQILQLSEQTNQIGSIAKLVSDLANQTNMLALNAAVEAVRAGENGKGFAVVASEIRKLADQSKGSAEKINTLVIDIQNAISASVIATDEGTRTVEQGVKTAQSMAETFVDVTGAINHIVLSSQQISLNAKQQATAIQQVVAAMNALSQGASETASGISQTKIGTQKLNEAALSLKTMI
jgi:methyl-accepting chemotaxis protein